MSRTLTLGLLTTLLAGLLVAGVSTAAGATVPTRTRYEPSWGSTRAPDQTLRPGCRRYQYFYRVTPPSDDWSAELTVRGPRGRAVASRTYFSDSDPAVARDRVTVCRATVSPGRFSIRMLVTSYADDFDNGTSALVRRSYFRLRNPR